MKPYTFERIYPSSGEEYSKPGILLILRAVLSVALLAGSYFVKLSDNIILAALIAAALIAGYDIVIKAVKDILKREFFHENLLVIIAVIASFAVGRKEEGIVALLLLQLAYSVRDYALYRTRKTINEVIEPSRKMLQGSDSDANSKPERAPGTVLSIFDGVAVASDCIIVSGEGTADLSFISGTNKRITLKKGDFLPAGSVCTGGHFKAEVADLPENALYRRLASILSSGFSEMTETERLWSRALSWFLPFALVVSAALMLVLPLIYQLSVTEAIRRVSTIIAVASPCGILLAVPLTYFSGMALARRLGIVFSNAKAFEKSVAIKAVVFNKVGTLTEKNYLVTDIKTDKMDPATFLKVAAYASASGSSPLSKAIVTSYGEEITKELVHDFVEYPDKGVSVSVDGIQILLGLDTFIEENGVEIPGGIFEGTVVHLSVNGIYAGRMALDETITQDATNTYFTSLAEVGVDRVAMVSGDRREKDRIVANELGIDEYYAECGEEEMVLRIAEIKGRIDTRGKLAFVGDSRNAMRLFEAADVGIAVNGISSHAELPKTDVIIMENGIGSIPAIIMVSRKVKTYLALGMLACCIVKLIIMALAAVGYAPVWFGLLIDFAVSLAVLLNCTRICARAKSGKTEA